MLCVLIVFVLVDIQITADNIYKNTSCSRNSDGHNHMSLLNVFIPLKHLLLSLSTHHFTPLNLFIIINSKKKQPLCMGFALNGKTHED